MAQYATVFVTAAGVVVVLFLAMLGAQWKLFVWMWGRFNELRDMLDKRIPREEYADRHAELALQVTAVAREGAAIARRVGWIERWASRLNGKLGKDHDYNSMIPPDER